MTPTPTRTLDTPADRHRHKLASIASELDRLTTNPNQDRTLDTVRTARADAARAAIQATTNPDHPEPITPETLEVLEFWRVDLYHRLGLPTVSSSRERTARVDALLRAVDWARTTCPVNELPA